MRKPVLTEGGGGVYPIRTLASMTGVNPVTLRAWERRYGLLAPMRTPKGHRLYADADVHLVRQVVEMLGSGIPISRAATIVRAGAVGAPGGDPQTPGDDVWSGYLTRMRRAIQSFNEDLLDAVYNEVLALYPTDVATERLILPLLGALGDQWREGAGGIAEEHFFSVYLRNKIGARFHHVARFGTGTRLVTACLPGERHETGLLLFALSAAARGFRLIQLGPSTPLAEVAVAAERSGAGAVVLSGSAARISPALAGQLQSLVSDLAVPVFVGGKVSVACQGLLEARRVHPLGCELIPALRRLDAVLHGTPERAAASQSPERSR